MGSGKSSRSDGPSELVSQLTDWAQDTAWVDWLELAGSLGRGAGDQWSDVDAGIGVNPDPESRLDSVEQAVTRLAPVAAVLRQPFGSASTHLLTIYADGRQLSLVVMPATTRTGLPPQAHALVDKTSRLGTVLDPATWHPPKAQQREWTFLACISASDALKHAARGKAWRAVRSLNEARDLYLQLLATHEQVVYPQFGAVSLENANRPIPDRLASTLVGTRTRQQSEPQSRLSPNCSNDSPPNISSTTWSTPSGCLPAANEPRPDTRSMTGHIVVSPRRCAPS